MDNHDLPHQETLARLYELRAMLHDGAELAACVLPPVSFVGPCNDRCGAVATRSYGRLDLCYACSVARLRVAEQLLPREA